MACAIFNSGTPGPLDIVGCAFWDHRMRVFNMDFPTVLNPQDILTPEELAARLKVRRSWIYEQMRHIGPRTIPHFKVGRHLRFSWAAVCEWLSSNARGSACPARKARRAA